MHVYARVFAGTTQGADMHAWGGGGEEKTIMITVMVVMRTVMSIPIRAFCLVPNGSLECRQPETPFG